MAAPAPKPMPPARECLSLCGVGSGVGGSSSDTCAQQGVERPGSLPVSSAPVGATVAVHVNSVKRQRGKAGKDSILLLRGGPDDRPMSLYTLFSKMNLFVENWGVANGPQRDLTDDAA